MKVGGVEDTEIGRRENRLDIQRHRHNTKQGIHPLRRRLRGYPATIDRHCNQQHIILNRQAAQRITLAGHGGACCRRRINDARKRCEGIGIETGKATLDTLRNGMKHREINVTFYRLAWFALIVVFADGKVIPPPLLALPLESNTFIGGNPWHPKETANAGNIEHRPGKLVESLPIKLLDAGKQALQHAQRIQRLLEMMDRTGRQNLGALAKALHQQGLFCIVHKTVGQQRQGQAKHRRCQHDGVTEP